MKRSDDPMQWSGCYSLDLYCDREGCAGEHDGNQFTGQTFAECARAAADYGWKLRRKTYTATCPACALKMSKPAASAAHN